jgi:hypothetical protein
MVVSLTIPITSIRETAPMEFLTTIDEIEKATGLDLLGFYAILYNRW